jgi:hypothetical protein
MDFQGWKTVAEYAEEQNITVQAVYHRAKTGKIKSRKIGTVLLVRD